MWRLLKKPKFALTFSDVHFQNLQIKAINSLSFVKKKNNMIRRSQEWPSLMGRKHQMKRKHSSLVKPGKQYLLHVCYVFNPDWLAEINYFSSSLQNPNDGSSEGLKAQRRRMLASSIICKSFFWWGGIAVDPYVPQ